MRILQLSPLWETVPPPAYGGTEAVVGLLADELVKMGHDVTLAASGDSRTEARLFSVYGRSLRRADDLADRNPYDWVHAAQALAQGRGFDIIHNHAGELAMAMSGLVDTPMLTTLHCLITPDTQFIWDRYGGAYNTISRSSRRCMPAIAGPARYMGHVYNGIDVDSFPFSAKKGEDLLFLSRISPEKGPQIAVEVAKRLGMRLIIAGKVDHFDRPFYDEVMRDLIDGDQIIFFGEANAAQKRELYRDAKCLLMPLQWEEPFGLVMPEAMACGTPVIAMRRGSAPELISHGETGFIVDTAEEMAEAVASVGSIDPQRCRREMYERFSPRRMALGYAEMYERMLAPRAARVTLNVDAAASRRDPDGEAELVVA